jgi:hypothetical protein
LAPLEPIQKLQAALLASFPLVLPMQQVLLLPSLLLCAVQSLGAIAA